MSKYDTKFRGDYISEPEPNLKMKPENKLWIIATSFSHHQSDTNFPLQELSVHKPWY